MASGESNFMKACLTLVSGDMTHSPLGSDREAGEDEKAVIGAGIRCRETAERAYKRKDIMDKGEVSQKLSQPADYANYASQLCQSTIPAG